MKTHLKTALLALLLYSIANCTNTNNKTNNASFKEDATIIIDTSATFEDYTSLNNDTSNIVWSFQSINNNDINNYIFENSPFLIFSLDSTFALINTGCNIYIGECTFSNNNIRFEKIKIKEEICPIDALEREIVYMLESSNHYILNNNNLILFTNDYPIGLLTIDTIIPNHSVMPATMP